MLRSIPCIISSYQNKALELTCSFRTRLDVFLSRSPIVLGKLSCFQRQPGWRCGVLHIRVQNCKSIFRKEVARNCLDWKEDYSLASNGSASSQPHTQLLSAFHSSNSAGEFRAEQAGVCCLICKSSHRRKPPIDRPGREAPILKKDAVTSNHPFVERQSRLGAIPLDKLINGVSVSALRLP